MAREKKGIDSGWQWGGAGMLGETSRKELHLSGVLNHE
jgi:hypothetical protein